MDFINTLPYISNPIEEFKDFKFVSWEKEIYPKFKGLAEQKEIDFFTNIIRQRRLKHILDLGVGGGAELAGIVESLKKINYNLASVEANELSDEFIKQATNLFYSKKIDTTIHKSNWIDFPNASPAYEHKFDFVFLTGNSLSFLGGGSREYTKNGIEVIISKFSKIIDKNGYLLIDTRNFDYIKSLINLPIKEVVDHFNFDYSIYYHGAQTEVVVFPAYISDTIVVLHYYDKKRKIWSKLDYFPLYEKDMLEILNQFFVIEKVYHDFEDTKKEKSLFIQYLVKKVVN